MPGAECLPSTCEALGSSPSTHTNMHTHTPHAMNIHLSVLHQTYNFMTFLSSQVLKNHLFIYWGAVKCMA